MQQALQRCGAKFPALALLNTSWNLWYSSRMLERSVSSTLVEKAEADAGSVSEAEMVSVKTVEPGEEVQRCIPIL